MQTNYLNGYQYESDSLRFFPHAEGRVLRFVSSTSGQVRYEREYTLKDHLGNLRLAYRQGTPTSYTATLETTPASRATQEEQQWDQQSLVSTRAQVYGQARTGSYVSRLNAAAGKPIGPLKLLPVQKGDTVTVTAPGYYPQRVSSGSSYAFSLLGYVAQMVRAAPAPVPAGKTVKPLKPLPFLNVGLAVVPALAQASGGVPKG